MNESEIDTHSIVETTIGEIQSLAPEARVIAIEALTKTLPPLLEAAHEMQLDSPNKLDEEKPRLHLIQGQADSKS